jgi:hypothetical protein
LSPQDPRYILALNKEPRIADTAVDLRQYFIKYTKLRS